MGGEICSNIYKPEACNFIKKETLALVFSCEFCEIFKNTFFYRTPPVAPSEMWSVEDCKEDGQN